MRSVNYPDELLTQYGYMKLLGGPASEIGGHTPKNARGAVGHSVDTQTAMAHFPGKMCPGICVGIVIVLRAAFHSATTILSPI